MRTLWAIMIAVLLIGSNCKAGDLTEIKTWVETNSWNTAVDNYNRGLQQDGLYRILNWACSSNYIISATNAIYYGYGVYTPKPCDKDHIDAYPKVSESVRGVQKVHRYQDVVKLDKIAVTNSYTKYDYPHLKLTEIVTREVVIKVSTNNVTEKTSAPVPCSTCGKL